MMALALSVAGPMNLAPFVRHVPVSFEHQKISAGDPGDGNPPSAVPTTDCRMPSISASCTSL